MDFLGRSFLEITLDALKSDAPLQSDIFVLLEKNQKIIRLVANGSIIDEKYLSSLKNRRGLKIYILEPNANPDSYKFNGATYNPDLPEAYKPNTTPIVPLGYADAEEPVVPVSEILVATNAMKANETTNFEEQNTLDPSTVDTATAETEQVFADNEIEEETTLRFGADPKTVDTERRFSADKEEEEKELRFGANQKKELVKEKRISGGTDGKEEEFRIKGGSNEPKEIEKRFSAERENKDTTEKRFSSSKEAKEETKRFSGGDLGNNKEAIKISDKNLGKSLDSDDELSIKSLGKSSEGKQESETPNQLIGLSKNKNAQEKKVKNNSFPEKTEASQLEGPEDDVLVGAISNFVTKENKRSSEIVSEVGKLRSESDDLDNSLPAEIKKRIKKVEAPDGPDLPVLKTEIRWLIIRRLQNLNDEAMALQTKAKSAGPNSVAKDLEKFFKKVDPLANAAAKNHLLVRKLIADRQDYISSKSPYDSTTQVEKRAKIQRTVTILEKITDLEPLSSVESDELPKTKALDFLISSAPQEGPVSRLQRLELGVTALLEESRSIIPLLEDNHFGFVRMEREAWARKELGRISNELSLSNTTVSLSIMAVLGSISLGYSRSSHAHKIALVALVSNISRERITSRPTWYDELDKELADNSKNSLYVREMRRVLRFTKAIEPLISQKSSSDFCPTVEEICGWLDDAANQRSNEMDHLMMSSTKELAATPNSSDFLPLARDQMIEACRELKTWISSDEPSSLKAKSA